jgi:hypothetical protein
VFQLLWNVKDGTKDETLTTTNGCPEETAPRADAKRITAVDAKPGGRTEDPSPSFCSLLGVIYKLYAYI